MLLYKEFGSVGLCTLKEKECKMRWRWLTVQPDTTHGERSPDTVLVGRGTIICASKEDKEKGIQDGARALFPPSAGIKASLAGKPILLIRRDDVLLVLLED